MNIELKDVKRFLEELNQDNITFDSHFYKRIKERPINESMVRSFLSQINKQRHILAKDYQSSIKIVGLANSKKMIFNYKF